MLSRVAESIFWMSTYIERADNIARFIHVNLNLILDLFLDKGEADWEPMIATTGDEKEFFQRYSTCTEEHVIKFLSFDAKNPNSIFSVIRNARENARSIRDVISSEMWEQINQFYILNLTTSRKRKQVNLDAYFDSVKEFSHLISGFADATMSHGEGWNFAKLGRMLERADKTLRILDVKYFLLLPYAEKKDSLYDTVQWGALLKSASAHEMYRKKHHRIEANKVAHFLLLDKDFPRSVHHCVAEAREALGVIIDGANHCSEILELIDTLYQKLANTSIEEILDIGLHDYIDSLQLELIEINHTINKTFFYPDYSRLTQSLIKQNRVSIQ